MIGNLIVSLLVLGGKDYIFLYCFQLYSIVLYIDVMMVVLRTMKDRGIQFLSTGVLLMIVILFFSGIAFFNFIPLSLNDNETENYCQSYFNCFLRYFNWGMRSGISAKIIKFEDNYYWARFTFEWLYFFFVNLILLNIVNGIIVDAFQGFREENTEKMDELENVCYVCRLTRADFEMKGFSFELHIEEDHNLLNYMKYLIGLRFTDKLDLTSVQTIIMNSMESKKVDFIPFKKAFILGH